MKSEIVSERNNKFYQILSWVITVTLLLLLWHILQPSKNFPSSQNPAYASRFVLIFCYHSLFIFISLILTQFKELGEWECYLYVCISELVKRVWLINFKWIQFFSYKFLNYFSFYNSSYFLLFLKCDFFSFFLSPFPLYFENIYYILYNILILYFYKYDVISDFYLK